MTTPKLPLLRTSWSVHANISTSDDEAGLRCYDALWCRVPFLLDVVTSFRSLVWHTLTSIGRLTTVNVLCWFSVSPNELGNESSTGLFLCCHAHRPCICIADDFKAAFFRINSGVFHRLVLARKHLVEAKACLTPIR